MTITIILAALYLIIGGYFTLWLRSKEGPQMVGWVVMTTFFWPLILLGLILTTEI